MRPCFLSVRVLLAEVRLDNGLLRRAASRHPSPLGSGDLGPVRPARLHRPDLRPPHVHLHQVLGHHCLHAAASHALRSVTVALAVVLFFAHLWFRVRFQPKLNTFTSVNLSLGTI